MKLIVPFWTVPKHSKNARRRNKRLWKTRGQGQFRSSTFSGSKAVFTRAHFFCARSQREKMAEALQAKAAARKEVKHIDLAQGGLQVCKPCIVGCVPCSGCDRQSRM